MKSQVQIRVKSAARLPQTCQNNAKHSIQVLSRTQSSFLALLSRLHHSITLHSTYCPPTARLNRQKYMFSYIFVDLRGPVLHHMSPYQIHDFAQAQQCVDSRMLVLFLASLQAQAKSVFFRKRFVREINQKLYLKFWLRLHLNSLHKPAPQK